VSVITPLYPYNQQPVRRTNPELVQDVIATIDYVHKNLHLKRENIAVLAHSSGADLAAAASLQVPDEIGLLMLVAFERIPPDVSLATTNAASFEIRAVQPSYGSAPQHLIVKNLQDAFGRVPVKLQVIPDDHNLMYLSSWAGVYASIFQYLNKGLCQ